MEIQNEYQNREFMIFNVSELDKIDFNQVYETSKDTLRYSKDGLKTFVKWDGDIPSSVLSLTTNEGAYTYDEMLDILSTEYWKEDETTSLSI
jgi:hypothetical protein